MRVHIYLCLSCTSWIINFQPWQNTCLQTPRSGIHSTSSLGVWTPVSQQVKGVSVLPFFQKRRLPLSWTLDPWSHSSAPMLGQLFIPDLYLTYMVILDENTVLVSCHGLCTYLLSLALLISDIPPLSCKDHRITHRFVIQNSEPANENLPHLQAFKV